MSQWFGGPGRKAGKSPGGAPDGSDGMSRGRSGRPLPRPATSANRPSNRPAENDEFAKPEWLQESAPPRNQPPAPRPAPAPQPIRPAPAPPGQFGRPASQMPRNQEPAQGYQKQGYQDSQYEQQYDQASSSQQYNDEQAQYLDQELDNTPERIEFKKRVVALIFDFLACYILAMGVMLIPFINSFLSIQLVMCLFLLIRDYTFEGRGIGKNLMGLQVVNSENGAPCSLKQSVMRNLVLIAPYALTQLVSALLRIVPLAAVNAVITNIVWGLCAVYVIIVIPLEVYRAYNRPDGQRLGDQLAETEVVESSMDFSRPLPR